MTDSVRYMTAEEFRDGGYLLEANRRFFHPLGLALEVDLDSDGKHIIAVWDCRDDPEGVNFADGLLDRQEMRDKVAKVRLEEIQRAPDRVAALGYNVQPMPGEGPR